MNYVKAFFIASLFTTAFHETPGVAGEKSHEIVYIRPQAPDFSIPAYDGQTSETWVPATLDLSEMARLAILGLTNCSDPDYDYEVYMWVNFNRKPPAMLHERTGLAVCKFMEGLPLMRIITGSTENEHVDRAWMEVLLKEIGPDGLIYYPMIGRPWIKEFKGMTWSGGEQTTVTAMPPGSQVAHPHVAGRYIGAMILYYLRDGNPLWRQTIERMIDRIGQFAVTKDDYCYFSPPIQAGFAPNAEIDHSHPMKTGFMSTFVMWNIQGFAQYYRVTGYEPAKELAGRLSRYLRDQSGMFEKDGRFLVADQEIMPPVSYTKGNLGKYGGHFHHHTLSLLAMLEYAMVANDQDMMKFVDDSFRYACNQGSTLTGFFPENIEPDYPTVEACEVADMIGLAVKLSEAGVGDYWDEVDRWVRNQFYELQMRRGDWVARWQPTPKPLEPNETSDRVAERNIGAFFGWSHFNDGASNMMHCCIGNASRAIYYAWQDILTFDEKSKELTVNLLMNRASPWADLDSFIPYQGRAVLHLKRDFPAVRVRIPEWVEAGSSQVTAKVGGKERKPEWAGRYMVLGGCKAGEDVELGFPIGERRVKERIGGTDFEMTIRGSTVVAVDPPGRTLPLYQREYLRQSDPLWRKTRRFTPADAPHW